MICYRCGSVLGAGKNCLHCGANIAIYKKIVRLSNSFYNAGLEKARVGDLSGAVSSLTKALEYDKKNIKARNLLGLVYYRMGEVVSALSHWVISKNFQSHDNPAQYYIEEIQNGKRELESTNQAIKKYNQALDSAKHDGGDLAIISLRSIISSQPHYIRAYELLGLLYIKEGEFSKANKVLKRALQIDKGNVTCQRYMNEIKGKMGKSKSKSSAALEKTAILAGDEVIIPESRPGAKLIQIVIGCALTFALCLAAYFFLIKPAQNRSINNSMNQNEISYYEKSEDKDASIQELSSQLSSIQEELELDKRRMEVYEGENGSITNYERMLACINLFNNGNYEELITTFNTINKEVITSEPFLEAYMRINEFLGSSEMLNKLMDSALAAFNAGNYSETRRICQLCIDRNPDFPKAIYYMALAYEAGGSDSDAAPYFKDIVTRFPSSEYYELAKRRVG